MDLTEKSVTEKKKKTEIELPDIPRNTTSGEKPNKKRYRKKSSQDLQFDV